MSFNKIIIVGNLGRDPELRYTPQGVAVASFSMATNEKKRDKSGELQDTTTWFKVTLWRERAETVAKYLVKGSPVYIEGRLRIEEWTDRENNNRYTLDVQATDMQFIGSRTDGDGGSNYESRSQSQYSGGGGGQQQEFPTHSGGGPVTPNSTSSDPAPSAPYSAPPPDDDIPF